MALYWEHIKGFNGSNTGGTATNIFSIIEWTRQSVTPSGGKVTSSDMPKLALLTSNPTTGVYKISNTGKLLDELKDGINGYNCGSLVATNTINRFTASNSFNGYTYLNWTTYHDDDIYMNNSNRIYFERYYDSDDHDYDLGYLSWIYSDNGYDWLEIHGHAGIHFSTQIGNSQQVIGYWGQHSTHRKSLIVGPYNTPSTTSVYDGYRLFVGDYVKINNYCEAQFFNATSDERAKENFNELNTGFLDIVKNMHIYSFNYKHDTAKKRTIGLIAQEVQNIDIDGFSLVENKNATGENGDFMMIRESKLIYVLLGAVQELTKEVEELKKRLGE